FVYANDLWLVDRAGGTALPLASPPGVETFPRFSPDGNTIAFAGNYDGGRDLYTIPTTGGDPVRVTHHPAAELMNDWVGNDRLLFASNGMSGLGRMPGLFTVGADGGMPEALPVPYGGVGSISPDGTWLAYTPHTRDHRTWKRYRGGMATDIWLFNLKDHSSKRMTTWEGTDSQPMWHGRNVYYVSDDGPEHRLNIWKYDTTTGEREQITHFSEFDIKWPAIGPGPEGNGEIVFQNGARLFLLDLESRKSTAVNVRIPGARPNVREHTVDASRFIQGWDISPTGIRAVVQARGDVWTLPAKNGMPRNLTRTNGVAERDPAWSPDGRWISYFSDENGEYDLYVTQSDGKG
ncbi:MAG: PD40 domain-containing protein, partial [Phycisphaerales bacterium]|nr:PD40 domain-containing protein [Phycisphaerales bacterium]